MVFQFRALKCTRNYIHCHLFSAFILRSISFLALFIISQPNQSFSMPIVLHQIVTMLSKLGHLAIFHWMLVEGLYLFKLIYWTYGLGRLRTRHFAIIGWGKLLDYFWLFPWTEIVCINYSSPFSPWITFTLYPLHFYLACFQFSHLWIPGRHYLE